MGSWLVKVGTFLWQVDGKTITETEITETIFSHLVFGLCVFYVYLCTVEVNELTCKEETSKETNRDKNKTETRKQADKTNRDKQTRRQVRGLSRGGQTSRLTFSDLSLREQCRNPMPLGGCRKKIPGPATVARFGESTIDIIS